MLPKIQFSHHQKEGDCWNQVGFPLIVLMLPIVFCENNKFELMASLNMQKFGSRQSEEGTRGKSLEKVTRWWD